MGSIYWTSNIDSSSTEDTKFIQCVDGQETQIHKLWCLSLDSITHEAHSTEQVEVVAETVEELTIDYLFEN